jgi:hypothetical protein
MGFRPDRQSRNRNPKTFCRARASHPGRERVMSPANTRPAPRKKAKHSRRAGCRSRTTRSIRTPSPWGRPLRRARRAIASCVGLIECSRRIVEASEESGALRPVQTTRALQKASGWIAHASAQLYTVVRSLNEASVSIAQAPEQATVLPERIILITAQYLGVAGALLATSDRLEATFAEIVAAQPGALLPDPSLYRRPAPVARRILFARPLAPKWPSCEQVPVITIHVRRRRTAPRTIAEPSKRVSRGRAPPPFSPASSTTAV